MRCLFVCALYALFVFCGSTSVALDGRACGCLPFAAGLWVEVANQLMAAVYRVELIDARATVCSLRRRAHGHGGSDALAS